MASFGTMFSDVLKALTRKPVTRPYPAEKVDAPDRLRGRLLYDSEKCTGCCLCMKDCPANAIEVITIDKKEKRFVMRYHADRCIYCGQCATSCRQGCIDMSESDWELAAATRAPFEVLYGEDADVDAFMERLTAPVVEAVEEDSGDRPGE